MPIEIRQLVIRSTIDSPPPAAEVPTSPEALDHLRAEILAECKTWFEEKLQQLRER